MDPVRLNKFLAERLGVSRREADDLITSGAVTIDGHPATLGARVDKTSKVCYNKKIIPFQTDYLYIMLNKPVGYVCSRRAQGSAPTIYDLLPPEYHGLKTVGRLDKDSSGLILLTNDGDFAFQMTHPRFRKTKVYEVELNKPLEPLHQQMISDYGVMLDDGVSRFKVIKDGNKYIVILHEGRNRQIRRTFASLGYRVTKLHRTEFGKYELGDLLPGEYKVIKI
ncbi:rRNA pseudouridine synthase [Candidatus Saccharibacteria bacterium]|nr:rRNA pseudouridine synthase [Candidatus Saccharibacteria bacterium]MBQ3413481.1 rRNA pseudouridine synthase [Candidatus Saccharibacteria bacterium]